MNLTSESTHYLCNVTVMTILPPPCKDEQGQQEIYMQSPCSRDCSPLTAGTSVETLLVRQICQRLLLAKKTTQKVQFHRYVAISYKLG